MFLLLQILSSYCLPIYCLLDFVLPVLEFCLLALRVLEAQGGRNIVYRMGLVSGGLGWRGGDKIEVPCKTHCCIYWLFVYKSVQHVDIDVH